MLLFSVFVNRPLYFKCIFIDIVLCKMQKTFFKKKKETLSCPSYFIEKSSLINNQYSIYLYYVFIVAYSCYVNMTLPYIECVRFHATSTTLVEVTSL